MIDIALAKAVVAHAKAHPVTFDEDNNYELIGDFGHDQSCFYEPKIMPEGVCKTRACLAGITVLLSPNAGVRQIDDQWPSGKKYTVWAPTIQGQAEDTYNDDEWDDAAEHLLGLTHAQANEIFYTMDELPAIHKLELLIREAESARANS